MSCAQDTSLIYVMGMQNCAWHVGGKHDMCRVDANKGAGETWHAHMESMTDRNDVRICNETTSACPAIRQCDNAMSKSEKQYMNIVP